MVTFKPLKITFDSLDGFISKSRQDLKKTAQEKKKSAQKKDVLVWASVESYQQFMSDRKI